MHSAEACQKCGSNDTYQIHSGSLVEWFLNAAGYQPCQCRQCEFQWNQLLPLNSFFHLVYLLLAMEICFLLWQYLP